MNLPHTVDVVTQIKTRDRYGGIKKGPTEVVVYADEPAWVQPAGAVEVEMYERRNMQITHTIYFKRDLNLQPDHSIRYGGLLFEVQGFRDATAGMGVYWKAHVSEVVEP